MALEPGATAPDFTLPDQHGNPVTLSDLRGNRGPRFLPEGGYAGHQKQYSTLI